MTVYKKSGQRNLRMAALALVVVVVGLVWLAGVEREAEVEASHSCDSLNVAVRVCNRQIDSLIMIGNSDADVGDLCHCEAVEVLACRDSLIAAGATEVADSALESRLRMALLRDSAILRAKIDLFVDMPRLHAELLGRLQQVRRGISSLANR